MRTLIATLALVAVAACGDNATNPSAAVVGTYNLQSVNGAPMPFVVQASGPKIEILSERLTVSSAGTFTVAADFRTTDGTSVTTNTYTSDGTYTVAGTTISFKDADGAVLPATIGNGTITLTDAGETLVFLKI